MRPDSKRTRQSGAKVTKTQMKVAAKRTTGKSLHKGNEKLKKDHGGVTWDR